MIEVVGLKFQVMSNYGRFGALLGTIYIGHTHCKFLVSKMSTASPIEKSSLKSFYLLLVGVCRTKC